MDNLVDIMKTCDEKIYDIREGLVTHAPKGVRTGGGLLVMVETHVHCTGVFH